jgi:formylglycine-generating enzyme
MSITPWSRLCPKCGGPIPAEASQGLCPKCLLMQASLPTEAGREASGKPDCVEITLIRQSAAGRPVMTKKANIQNMKRNPYCTSILSVLALFAGLYSVLAQTTPLSIALAGNQVVISWPAAATNCFLQSATSPSPATWSTVSAVPVEISGQYTVTNCISGTQQFYQLSQIAIPSGMALIPAGSFTMGDTLDGESDAIPTNVTVSMFYMDTNLVSCGKWKLVYNYAIANGYGFDNAGAGKDSEADQPVQTVDWYDTVKWSNARSQQAGLTPVYYTDTNLTQVYTNGDVDAVYVNWAASGYRLPTEAEWEKAARGGLSGQRFPWGDTISESQANYYGCTSCYSYDFGPNGYNSIGSIGGTSPATSPVGSFAANGYGLYDMAGNVLEWCWDWYGTPYGQPTTTNPTGLASGSNRVLRGGYWFYLASFARCANRYFDSPDVDFGSFVGFRCVRGL